MHKSGLNSFKFFFIEIADSPTISKNWLGMYKFDAK